MAGLRARTRPPAPLPYTLTLDGRPLTIPAHPVRWWIRTLAAEPPGCWWHILPAGLGGDGTTHVISRLVDPEDPLDLDDIERCTEQAVTALLGMDMWAAHRLMSMAYSNWVVFDGWCLSTGFDPAAASHPARVAAAVYAWRMSHCQKKQDVTKLDAEVWAPPPIRMASGRLRDQAPTGWDDHAEEAAFTAAVANLKR